MYSENKEEINEKAISLLKRNESEKVAIYELGNKIKLAIIYFCEFETIEKNNNTIIIRDHLHTLLIVEIVADKLVIKPDPLGIYTKLHYYVDDNKLVVASEIKPIVAQIGFNKLTINNQAVESFFNKQHIPITTTPFNEIKTTIIFEYLIYDCSKKQLLSISDDSNELSLNKKQLFKTITDILKKYTEIDYKNKMVWLSGGLDSRVLTELLKFQQPLIINFGAKSCQDHIFAKKYLRKNTLPFEHIIITPEMLVKNVERHSKISEGFSDHLNAHISGTLSKYCQQPTLIYDGFAGDVILGGNQYPYVQKNKTGELSYHNLHVRNITRSGSYSIGSDFGKVLLPFYDYKLFYLMLSVPLELRKDHEFYKNFLQKQYPQLLKIPSTSLRTKKKKKKINSLFEKLKIKSLATLEFLFKTPIAKEDHYVNPAKWLRENKQYYNFVSNLTIQGVARGVITYNSLELLFKDHLNYKKDHSRLLVKLADFELFNKLYLDGGIIKNA